MQIEVEENPNCLPMDQMVFNTLEEPRIIEAIITGEGDDEAICDVVGVDPEGKFSNAFAQKINDSGEGAAYLIYGGAWGIRLRPRQFNDKDWSLNEKTQWGEPYKVYGRLEDILFKS